MSAELQNQVRSLQQEVTKLQSENKALRGSADVKGKIQCIIGNVDEYAEEIDRLLPDADGDGKIDKIPFFGGINVLMQVTWDKIKETRLECYGKATEVEYPEGWKGAVLEFALKTVGIRL